MSQTLHLGVIDIPYLEAPASEPKQSKAKKGKGRKKKVGPHPSHAKKYEHLTTGDVAEILEDHYQVMRHFYEAHQKDIADELANDVAGSLETLMMGGKTELTFGTATSAIEKMFKQALSNKEFDNIIPGVPTLAAKLGVSHRFRTSIRSSARKTEFHRHRIVSGVVQIVV